MISSPLCCRTFPPAVSQSDELLMLSPESRLLLLDHIFLRFDELVKQAGALKIETVGEVYLVAANVAGLPVPDHALVLSRLALHFVSAVHELAASFRADAEALSDSSLDLRLEVRVGINSGPVIGGVIGKLLPRYRIFGDTVNTAARMETSSEPGRVHLSDSAAEILRGSLPPDLGLTPRGEISVKGKVSPRHQNLSDMWVQSLARFFHRAQRKLSCETAQFQVAANGRAGTVGRFIFFTTVL